MQSNHDGQTFVSIEISTVNSSLQRALTQINIRIVATVDESRITTTSSVALRQRSRNDFLPESCCRHIIIPSTRKMLPSIHPTSSSAAAANASTRHFRSRSSASSLTSTILLVSVGLASFFAGTLYTMHSGIDKCSNKMSVNSKFLAHEEHRINARVEELTKKRVQGKDRVWNLPF